MTSYQRPVGVRVGFRLVTPELAAQWLSRNYSNRPLDRDRVNQYARAIREGDWQQDGSTIKFTSNMGRLLDGQHRCYAIVQTGVPLWMLVCEGVSPNAFATIDTNKTRQGSDALSLHDVENSRQIAPTIQKISQFYRMGMFGEGGGSNKLTNLKITRAWDALDNAFLARCVKTGYSTRGILPAPSMVSAIGYLLGPENEIEYTKMLSDIVHVQVDGENDPACLLLKAARNWKQVIPPLSDIAALILKAFDARRRKRSMKRLSLRANEAYPVITGTYAKPPENWVF